MLTILVALALGQHKLADPPPSPGKFSGLFERRALPETLQRPAPPVDWPSPPAPTLSTDWPVRNLPAALRPEPTHVCAGKGCECAGGGACGGSGCRCQVAALLSLPEQVFAPEPVQPRVRFAAMQKAEEPAMPVPSGIRKPAPVAHAVACPCCGESCACVAAGDCGHPGCACGHAVRPPAVTKVYPSPQAVQTTTKAPAVTYAAPAPVYTYQQALAYQVFYPQVYGGYGQPLYGATVDCANGACYVPARGGLFGGRFR